ncbi:MAG: hypothetical protein LBH25_00005 [Fibromonadaceae bacterium]|nr:hypothetical protein [Fibromonadaceae bacterium]
MDNLNLLGLCSNNSMPSLKNISASTMIELRLLACIHVNPLECEKHSNQDSDAKKLCNIGFRFYAHIYFREKLARADIKHHLVVFIKGSINIPTIKRRLNNTLEFLEIGNEKTFFHIMYYPSIVSGMGVNKQNIFKKEQSECNDELKKCFNYGYKETEQICEIYLAKYEDYSIAFSGSNPIMLTLA